MCNICESSLNKNFCINAWLSLNNEKMMGIISNFFDHIPEIRFLPGAFKPPSEYESTLEYKTKENDKLGINAGH
ncbi:MAG: hypothetical protein ACTSRA_10325 [Promethearchaeota archaeon]